MGDLMSADADMIMSLHVPSPPVFLTIARPWSSPWTELPAFFFTLCQTYWSCFRGISSSSSSGSIFSFIVVEYHLKADRRLWGCPGEWGQKLRPDFMHYDKNSGLNCSSYSSWWLFSFQSWRTNWIIGHSLPSRSDLQTTTASVWNQQPLLQSDLNVYFFVLFDYSIHFA